MGRRPASHPCRKCRTPTNRTDLSGYLCSTCYLDLLPRDPADANWMPGDWRKEDEVKDEEE